MELPRVWYPSDTQKHLMYKLAYTFAYSFTVGIRSPHTTQYECARDTSIHGEGGPVLAPEEPFQRKKILPHLSSTNTFNFKINIFGF